MNIFTKMLSCLFLTSKLNSFNTKILLCLLLFTANHADSKDGPGMAQQFGVPAQIENLASEVGELKEYVRVMVSKQCNIYEALGIPLQATCDECPCFTHVEMSAASSEYLCHSDPELNLPTIGIRAYVWNCELNGSVTKGWADFMIEKGEDRGLGCSRYGYVASGHCVDEPGSCENYTTGPRYVSHTLLTEGQFRACESILLRRISEMGLDCDIQSQD